MTTHPARSSNRHPLRRRRNLVITSLAGVCVVLTACGSVVPPSKYLSAQGGLGQAYQQSGANNGQQVPGGVVPTVTGSQVVVPTGSNVAGATGTNHPTNGSTGTVNPGNGQGSNPGGTVVGVAQGGAAAGDTIGSCNGFNGNQTGINNTTINLANASDISGPVPGLFTGAQQGLKAYVQYFNSTVPNGICGRKLTLENLDSQTSSNGDQQAATSACGNAFAMVGSMSAFDDGGAQTVQRCGIPDLRAAATEQGRINVPNVFGAMSLNARYIPTEPPTYYKQHFPTQTQHAAMLWLAAGAAQLNGQNEMNGFTQAGMKFVYHSGISVETINYSTYVAAMQSKGVQWVEFVGAIQYAVRLAQAMAQQNFHPVFVLDPEFYDPSFVATGGSAVNGVHIWANQVPFEQVGSNPEMQKYEQWLAATSPGAKPNYFGMFAWEGGDVVHRQRPVRAAERGPEDHRQVLSVHQAERHELGTGRRQQLPVPVRLAGAGVMNT
jgi:ABC-type branched-subunit amino acid transport system substrate-binding protein